MRYDTNILKIHPNGMQPLKKTVESWNKMHLRMRVGKQVFGGQSLRFQFFVRNKSLYFIYNDRYYLGSILDMFNSFFVNSNSQLGEQFFLG